jgi:hypothetical protein
MDVEQQTTAYVVMIRPRGFGPNAETAASNVFQQAPMRPLPDLQAQAVKEFDGMIGALNAAGAHPIVFEDTDAPPKPDAVFPNNWVSFHADGTVYLYPMEAPGRRAERRTDIIESLSETHAFRVREIVDLARLETNGSFLEGTGSMVLDRTHHVVYAALSSRTHMDALAEFAQQADYEITAFEATESSGRVVYHTNVMMTLGQRFAVICADSIVDARKRETVLARLVATGREIIGISIAQMERFAGNLLELATDSGTSLIVMSRTAHQALSDEQLESLAHHGRIVSVAIPTIEAIGGGSVRCMMAEVFLPREKPPAIDNAY